jgi:hypothetical protein
MQIEQRTVDVFVDRMRARDPFAFSRWGDGEWNSLFGRTHGHNSDQHRYFADMGADLCRVLLSRPAYMLGIQNLALRIYEGRIEESQVLEFLYFDLHGRRGPR